MATKNVRHSMNQVVARPGSRER